MLLAPLLVPIDPAMHPAIDRELSSGAAGPELPPDRHIVLVGHRAAGKSALLTLLAPFIGRPAVDLDATIEALVGRSARALFAESEAAFRAAERAAFAVLTKPSLVAAGGGFLALHQDLLRGHLAVLVPISFPTYRERLLRDAARPRLRPELTLEAEIEAVFAEREALHARVETVPLGALLRAVGIG